MEGNARRIGGMFARYLAVLLLGLGNLKWYYSVLTPLTLKTLVGSFTLFGKQAVLEGTFIGLNNFTIEIVPACVAGAAFYLMTILVFTTANIRPQKRLKVLLFALGSLFVLNMLRIFVLVPLIGSEAFEPVHWTLWNFSSTIFVFGIWVGLVKFQKIKAIPVWSDFKYVWSLVKQS